MFFFCYWFGTHLPCDLVAVVGMEPMKVALVLGKMIMAKNPLKTNMEPETWRKKIPSLKLTFLPLKIGLPNRKVVFQPSIFRGYVSFREAIYFFKGNISSILRFHVSFVGNIPPLPKWRSLSLVPSCVSCWCPDPPIGGPFLTDLFQASWVPVAGYPFAPPGPMQLACS